MSALVVTGRCRRCHTTFPSHLLKTSWFSGVLCCIVQVVVEYFAANEWRCLLVAWLRQVGFIVVYGSLMLKIYRSVQRTGPTGPQRLLCMMSYGNRSSSSADRVVIIAIFRRHQRIAGDVTQRCSWVGLTHRLGWVGLATSRHTMDS